MTLGHQEAGSDLGLRPTAQVVLRPITGRKSRTLQLGPQQTVTLTHLGIEPDEASGFYFTEAYTIVLKRP